MRSDSRKQAAQQVEEDDDDDGIREDLRFIHQPVIVCCFMSSLTDPMYI